FVVAEAMKLGFRNGDPDWCNLGQGQPEVGTMAGAPKRIASVSIEPEDHAYGPLGGTPELRGAVARPYNRLYPRGRARGRERQEAQAVPRRERRGRAGRAARAVARDRGARRGERRLPAARLHRVRGHARAAPRAREPDPAAHARGRRLPRDAAALRADGRRP